MQLLSNFKQWLNGVAERIKKKRAVKRKKQIERQCCRDFQIMEFDGKVYICHEGVPVIKTDSLKGSATDVLVQSRKDFIAWREKFEAS